MGALKEPPKLSEEELPEARVSTHLVRNQVTILGEDGTNGGLFTVGPYQVLRGLVRAPGAWLCEARGPTGERAVIQLVHCRAVRSRAEELERQAFERAIAQETVDLFDEPSFVVHAHGHVLREDQSRILFWALPWHEGALHLTTPGATIRDAAHLIDVAIALSTRLHRRHERDRLDPLMSEHLVAVTPIGADLLGVPLFIPPSWLAPEMPSCKLAPEEVANLQPTRIGDMWRLGQTLTALAAGLDAIPSAFSNLLKWMTHEDARKRPPRPLEVRVECESIKEKLAQGAPLTAPSRVASIPALLSFEEVSQLVVASMGPGGESSDPVQREMAILHGEDEVTLAGSVNVEALSAPPSPTGVPPWAFFFSAREYDLFVQAVEAELNARGVGHRIGTGVVQLIAEDGTELEYVGLSEVARDCFRTDQSRWRALIAEDLQKQLGADVDTVDDSGKKKPVEEPTQRIEEKHLRPIDDDPPTEPPSGPTPAKAPGEEPGDRLEIVMGDAVDVASLSKQKPPPPEVDDTTATLADRPAVQGPNPTSPYAGTLPSQNQDDARVPEGLRQKPEVLDDLPFRPTLPAPQDQGRVPEDLREQAQATLKKAPAPDPEQRPRTGTIPASGPIAPNHAVRALAFPRPQAPVVPKGYTVPAGPSPLRMPEPPHPQPLRPAKPQVSPERSLIQGKGTLDPSMAAAARGTPLRNLLVALLLVLTVGAVVGAIMVAEQPPEPERLYSEISLDGEIILRADPPNAVIVGETDGRILGQAPLRFLLPPGGEAGVIVTSPGMEPKRVTLTGAGEVTASLDPISKHAKPCAVPFDGVEANDLTGVTGNLDVENGRLHLEGASIVRTKPGSKRSGAWIVRCPPGGLVDTLQLEPRPLEPAELRISKPQEAIAFVEGHRLGPIPVSQTVPEAFTKIAIDDGQGEKGPLWVPVHGPTELRLSFVPENLSRRTVEKDTPAKPAKRPKKRRRHRRRRRR